MSAGGVAKVLPKVCVSGEFTPWPPGRPPHPATRVHDGTDPDAVIAGIFEHPSVERIHSRNVAYGCYMFEIRRTGPARS
jgi:Protein of unknown function (DUF1203)